MQINIKIILDAIKFLKMRQENKNLIIKRIEIIHKLFDNFQLMRKKIENTKSKNLVNNQIFEEVKRRIVENKKFYEDKVNDIEALLNKKVIILKKVQKKFIEIQIYIRRESQNFYGFRKQFVNFTITPFILENEYLNRQKAKINETFEEKIKYMKILYIPIKHIKNKKKEKKEKNEINIINNADNIDNKENSIDNINNINNKIETANEQFNKFIINKQEEIKFYENKNMFLKKMNLIYRSKIIPKKNMFKNEINLYLNISQETQNNNEISMINQINNGENLESNINNTFYELFTVESVAKSGMINNSTFIQDEDIYK